MKAYIELFVSFFKVGILTFGGGMAMLPMLQSEIVENKKWATEEEVLNYFAVGQCTPGIIAVNTATFIGYKQKKVLGGIIATLGVITPSFIIIVAIASILTQFRSNVWVQHAFSGVRIAVSALILSAIVKLWKNGIKDGFGVVLFLVAFGAIAILGISSVWLVLVAIVAGNIYQLVKTKRGAK